MFLNTNPYYEHILLHFAERSLYGILHEVHLRGSWTHHYSYQGGFRSHVLRNHLELFETTRPFPVDEAVPAYETRQGPHLSDSELFSNPLPLLCLWIHPLCVTNLVRPSYPMSLIPCVSTPHPPGFIVKVPHFCKTHDCLAYIIYIILYIYIHE